MQDNTIVHAFNQRLYDYVMLAEEVDDAIFDDRRVLHASDHLGSLLHYAAVSHNTAVIQQLIRLGSNVNLVGGGRRTPFMLAIKERCTVAVATIFLEANANIDIVATDERSVLQRALGSYDYDSSLVVLFVERLRKERPTPEALATRLIAAGCKMFEAATFRDVAVMQCMLDHGIDINLRNIQDDRTVLHRAAEMSDVDMVEWLVQNGADVHPIDLYGMSALLVAARNQHFKILKMLLEGGSDPNCDHTTGKNSPLHTLLKSYTVKSNSEEADKCIELLLLHGATLFDLTFLRNCTIIDHALHWSSDETVKMLISQLAVFKGLDSFMSEPVVFCSTEKYRRKQAELEEFYQFCLQVLKTKLFEDLSLLDLLNASESRLNSLVRRKMFVPKLNSIISEHKLSKIHEFYYKRLMKRIDKVHDHVVKLKNKAILAIFRLFRRSFTQCYVFALEIIGFLEEHELEQLDQV